MFDCRNQAWGQEPTQIAMVATVVGEVVGGERRVTTDDDDGVARTNYESGVSGTKAPVAAVEEERGDGERCDGAEVEGDGRDSEDRRDGEEALCEADQQAANLDLDAAAPGVARAAAAVPKHQHSHVHQDV